MQVKELIGTPDFVFDKERLILFGDGCFWHGYPDAGRMGRNGTGVDELVKELNIPNGGR